MTRQGKAYAYALTTIGLWSTVASACKLTLRYMSPEELVFYSTFTSCLVLGIVVFWQKKMGELRTMDKRAWLLSCKLGFLNPFLYYLILFKAYDLLPAQQAQPLNYTWAITLSLLSVPLLGQKLSRGQIIAIGVSYLGVVIISTQGALLSLKFENPLGVGLALLSTIFWSLYWIGNTRDNRDPVVGLFMNFLCALPCIGIYVYFTAEPGPVKLAGLLGAAYLGMFEMGVAFLLWLMAMKLTLSTAKIANLIFLSPFLSLVFIYLLVGERIFLSTIVGLVLIVAGLVIQGKSKPPQEGEGA